MFSCRGPAVPHDGTSPSATLGRLKVIRAVVEFDGPGKADQLVATFAAGGLIALANSLAARTRDPEKTYA